MQQIYIEISQDHLWFAQKESIILLLNAEFARILSECMEKGDLLTA